MFLGLGFSRGMGRKTKPSESREHFKRRYLSHLNRLIVADGRSVFMLSELSGISKTTLYQVLKGKRTPNLDTLLGLAEILGIEYSEVLTVVGGSG